MTTSTTLDGKFDDNVIVQIKNGPIDFQVREPASPLFGALEKTNEAIELQITQEYIGQARHTVFLVPMWKETLDFDMRDARNAPDAGEVAGAARSSASPTSGLDDNWFGNHLSQANLYGFGRLAWNPDLTSQQIADEWTRLTFGDRSQSERDHRRHAAQLLAHLRKLHRPARPADAHRYHRQSLRRQRRSFRAQRLGPVASRRREGRRHGPHRRHRHRLHRPIQPRGRAHVTNRSRPAPTICCCSCITSRTPTSCIPARR